MGGEAPRETPVDSCQYKANDLIVFHNNKHVGIVLGVERGFLTVLDADNEAKTIRIQDVNVRKEIRYLLHIHTNRRTPGLDSMRNSISSGDSVRVVEGENKGKKGTIVHIHKNIVFLYNPEHPSHNGLFVERARNLVILGAELLSGPRDDDKRRRRPPATGTTNPDGLYRKMVRIMVMPYKNYEGILVGFDKDTAKIELSSKAKIITVKHGQYKDASAPIEGDNQPEQPVRGGTTPAYCPQSPQWIAATPAPQSPGNQSCIPYQSHCLAQAWMMGNKADLADDN
jgi:transcription elongation factor